MTENSAPMTTTERTPALGDEWEYHRGEDYAVVMLPDETTDTASITVAGDDDDGTDALGHLIASAPLMLKALQAAEDRHQRGILNMADAEIDRVHELRRYAIASATGVPQ